MFPFLQLFITFMQIILKKKNEITKKTAMAALPPPHPF